MRKTVVYIVVLATLILGVVVALTGMRYQKTVLNARESVLREDLVRLRAMLKEYAQKQVLPPQSLDDLVEAGYLREIPDDPITGNKDWQVTEGEFERASKKVKGIVDVHSSSARNSSIGTPYNQW
jgi:general secretion pathway protein G